MQAKRLFWVFPIFQFRQQTPLSFPRLPPQLRLNLLNARQTGFKIFGKGLGQFVGFLGQVDRNQPIGQQLVGQLNFLDYKKDTTA